MSNCKDMYRVHLYPSLSGDATAIQSLPLQVAGVKTSMPGGVIRVSFPLSSST